MNAKQTAFLASHAAALPAALGAGDPACRDRVHVTGICSVVRPAEPTTVPTRTPSSSL